MIHIKFIIVGWFECFQRNDIFLHHFVCYLTRLFLRNGATNDSWANSPVGEFKWEGWNEEDLTSFRPALAYLLTNITSLYPDSRFLYIVNDGLKDEITSSIMEACEKIGMPYIQLEGIDKTAGHPNIHSMQQIAARLRAGLHTEE